MAATKLVYLVLTFVACIIIGSSSIVGATWCVATDQATPDVLKKQMDYLCGHGADCSAIKEGGSCFQPNTQFYHASYAFNSYFARSGGNPNSCNYGGAATIVYTDPSYGTCKYPTASKGKNGGTI